VVRRILIDDDDDDDNDDDDELTGASCFALHNNIGATTEEESNTFKSE
jgi:hypothetical protein